MSARVIERCLGAGRIVRVHSGAPSEERATHVVDLPRLTAADLEPWFVGPNRLFHLGEDAAALLFARSGGSAARIRRELHAWLETGLARRSGDAFIVDRDALDRLAMLPATVHRDWDDPPGGRRPSGAMASWVRLAGENALPERLAAAMSEPLWQVEAELDELVLLKLTSIGESGAHRLEPTACIDDFGVDDDPRAAHGRLAAILPRGTPGRLALLLEAAPPTICAPRSSSRRRPVSSPARSPVEAISSAPRSPSSKV